MKLLELLLVLLFLASPLMALFVIVAFERLWYRAMFVVGGMFVMLAAVAMGAWIFLGG